MTNKLVIFDMDGVISDTQKYHAQSEVEILKGYGITTISPDSDQKVTIEWINSNFSGMQPKVWMKVLFEAHGIGDKFDIETIEHQKNATLLGLYTAGAQIDFIPGAQKLLDVLHADEEIRTAVITASTRECMLCVLKSLNVVDQFDDLVSIYDVDPETQIPYTSKADPQVYERLKDKYGTETFVMVEDGTTGMNGALKAGGKAVAILGKDYGKGKFPQAIAWHTDLITVTVEEIKNILG